MIYTVKKTIVTFTCRYRCRCQYRYANSEISKWPFPWILSVSYGKEGVSSKDRKFVWNTCQAFWRDFQSQQGKPYLAFASSKATIKTLEQKIWNMSKVETTPQKIHRNNIVKRCCVVFIIIFERISYLVLVLLLLTLNIYMTDGNVNFMI